MDNQNDSQNLTPLQPQPIVETKKWYQYKGIWIIVALVILAIIAGYFVIKQQQIFTDYSPVPRPYPVNVNLIASSSSNSVQQTNSGNIPTPSLFSDDNVKWQKITFDAYNPSFEFSLRFDNFKYQTDPKNRLQKFIPLSGNVWTAKVDDSAGVNLDQIYSNFSKYYEDTLKQSGWSFAQDIPSKQISINGPIADGAQSSVWGYVKTEGNSIRLIGLSYNKSISKWVDIPGSAPKPVCPCGMEFKVFISDIVDVSSLKF